MNITKILVTGASGLLGTEICKQLVKDSSTEVWGLDNHSRSSTIPPSDVWIQGDLRNKETLYHDLPNDFDYVYHYSAVNGTKNFYERPNEVLSNNLISDIHVFEWASTLPNLKKLIYASTSEIVSGYEGSVSELTDISINNIHNPRWSYRIAKIASENYLVNSKLPWIIIRYFNIYGTNSKEGHFIADQIHKLNKGIYELVGSNETRSFCYIEDAITATIHLANNIIHDVINVGNDDETMILDAANILANEMGITPEWQYKDGVAGSTSRRLPNISKLRELMPSYKPRSFKDGVKMVLNTSP